MAGFDLVNELRLGNSMVHERLSINLTIKLTITE